MAHKESLVPARHDERVIIHFDYDCFYAAVFEREDPKLRQLPFAVQQKQIIVTCNYEARRRGLYKLQLVKEARKKCPEVIIALGEDLTRFRNASKDNYNFLRNYAWSRKVERLGFDEVFMDVTDMVEYNIDLLNHNALKVSFFHLDRNDPTVGFGFDASSISGHTFPAAAIVAQRNDSLENIPTPVERSHHDLNLRLLLGSHLAQYLRHQLEEHKSYTCTVGVGTNKLISKLVGNLNKPKGQTTLLPPYERNAGGDSNIARFLDPHDIGKIPGIGFLIAQKIRQHVLKRPANFDTGLVYGPTQEQVSVGDVRLSPGMNKSVLEKLLAGPGLPKELGFRVWGLINGVDDTEVAKAKDVPQQISSMYLWSLSVFLGSNMVLIGSVLQFIAYPNGNADFKIVNSYSYIKLDTMPEVRKELTTLMCSLVKRMRLDLTNEVEEDMAVDVEASPQANGNRRWTAHPRTLRLTTRPRPPRNPDGSRSRMFNRISKSCPMPSIAFSFSHRIDTIVEKVVNSSLLPLFHLLHPEISGWDLSLVNLCATNMALMGTDNKEGSGRDIGQMFRRQDDVLKVWKIEDVDVAPSQPPQDFVKSAKSESMQQAEDDNDLEVMGGITQDSESAGWNSDAEMTVPSERCAVCGVAMPSFAMSAHQLFHSLSD